MNVLGHLSHQLRHVCNILAWSLQEPTPNHHQGNMEMLFLSTEIVKMVDQVSIRKRLNPDFRTRGFSMDS